MKLLISRGAEVNAKDDCKLTAPCYFDGVCSCWRRMRDCALRHDVRRENADGVTPLHIAARAGDVEMCSLLVSLDATVDTKDDGASRCAYQNVCSSMYPNARA